MYHIGNLFQKQISTGHVSQVVRVAASKKLALAQPGSNPPSDHDFFLILQYILFYFSKYIN